MKKTITVIKRVAAPLALVAAIMLLTTAYNPGRAQGLCEINLSTNYLYFPGTGGTQSVTVSLPLPCPYIASPTESWISVETISNGISITCEANPGNARTGQVVVDEISITINQGCDNSGSSSNTISVEGERVSCFMPSSEGAALVKAIERQPSLATGTPDISIPIYSIPNTPVNIRLSYNASGLLANELPTIAGLGWRIETGGMITRVVLGLPDDYPSNGYLNRSQQYDDLASKTIMQYAATDIATLKSLNTYSYDDSPDVFYYEIMGIKGKFVLGRNGEAYCYPRSNVKITYTQKEDRTIDQFTIKFPNGNSAELKASETCTVTGYSTVSSPFTSSWAISNLRSNTKVSMVTYTYGEQEYSSRKYTISNFKAEERQVIDSEGAVESYTFQYNVEYKTKQLYYIETFNTRVQFDYSAKNGPSFAGVEAPAWAYLKNLSVTFPQETHNIKYQYDFLFNGLDDATTYDRQNFLLLSFSMTSSNVELPYQFIYYPISLPNLGSTSVDLWGYYNGASNGGSIIPNIYSLNGKLTSLPLSGLTPLRAGANRSSSESSTRSGVLKSITTPEGLTTEYEYELNRFLVGGYTVNGGGLRIKTLKKFSGTTLMEQEDFTYQTEGAAPTTSGVPLYIPMPAIGMSTSNTPLTSSSWSGYDTYIKASYLGAEGMPYTNPLYYSNVQVAKSGTGSTSYAFGLPVERGNSAILPAELSWANTAPNTRRVDSGTDRLILANESDPDVPTLFHLWTDPLLLSVADKNQSGVTVRSTSFSYRPLEIVKIPSGLRILPKFVNTLSPPCLSPVVSSILQTTKSYHLSAWRELLSQSETVFDLNGNNGITHTRQFAYAKPENEVHFSFIGQLKAADASGESSITRYKYCFDNEFNFSASLNASMAALQNNLEQCLEQARIDNPSREGQFTEAQLLCYEAYDLNAPSIISPEAQAISLLKEQGDYSTPLETVKIVERHGSQTVVSASFATMQIQESRTVLPVTNYSLLRPTPLSEFSWLRIIQSPSNYMLAFDENYGFAGGITRYSVHNEVLEYLGKDNVYTSMLYSEKWDRPVLQAVNCRYDAIMGINPDAFDENSVRASNPLAMITTQKYQFPLGVYRSTDPRGRTTHTIYNVLGEVVGVKDHNKDLRAVSINKRKLQNGNPSVVLSTEPDGDYTVNMEVVPASIGLSVNSHVSHQNDMSYPVNIYLTVNPAYQYTISYDGGVETPVTSSSFTHKYTTAGSHTVTVRRKNQGQTIETAEDTIALIRNPLIVSYEYVRGEGELNHFEFTSSRLEIKAIMHGGTGEYTVTWTVTSPTSTTTIDHRSVSGSISPFLASEEGDYVVSVTIDDGVETFEESWTFNIRKALSN